MTDSSRSHMASPAQPVRFADLLSPRTPAAAVPVGSAKAAVKTLPPAGQSDSSDSSVSVPSTAPSTGDSDADALHIPSAMGPPQTLGVPNDSSGMPAGGELYGEPAVLGGGMAQLPHVRPPASRLPTGSTDDDDDDASGGASAKGGPRMRADTLLLHSSMQTVLGSQEARKQPTGPAPSGQIGSAFGPLQTQLPDPGQLETLAPTTPSEATQAFTPIEAPAAALSEGVEVEEEQQEDITADSDSGRASVSTDAPPTAVVPAASLANATAVRASGGSGDADDASAPLQYSPFGLQGLQKAFPMQGPGHARAVQLLSEKQALAQMQTLGLPPKDAKPGAHLLQDGGAVVVHQERAYRVNHLDAGCVHALRAAPEALMANFLRASEAIQTSQEIARLTSLSKSASAVANSPVLACSGAKTLRDRLAFLNRSCDEWSAARSKVAKLMHQRKARADQIENLQKQLSTMKDVLTKDTEAVAIATKEEKRMAQSKRKIVLALSAEINGEVAGLARLRKSVSTATRSSS